MQADKKKKKKYEKQIHLVGAGCEIHMIMYRTDK